MSPVARHILFGASSKPVGDSTQAQRTNIQLSGWDALGTSFYAWSDPDQQGTVVVLWPSGWNKE